MYWFGEKLTQIQDIFSQARWDSLPNWQRELALTPLDDIISLLDDFSHAWKKGEKCFETALPMILQTSSFTPREVEQTLSLLPGLLSRESLLARIRGEFIQIDVLDKFSKPPEFSGLVKAAPKGRLLHVTAGNVFLSCIDSLLMGFLTKNISLLKVSSENTFFPIYFAQELARIDERKILANKFAILQWKGGDHKTEAFLCSKVQVIVAWGGEEMVKNYQRYLNPELKLLDFGPKLSLQIISREGLKHKSYEKVAAAVTRDITPWDQTACASPQNLYLQEGIDEDEFLKALNQAFIEAPPRGQLTEDESVEVLKERYRGFYSELMQEGKVLLGESHLLHLESNRFPKPSPLGRTLIIKKYKDADELLQLLTPFAWYLQSCGYLLGDEEKSSYLNLLALSGIKRFAPLGSVTLGKNGAPHDGRYVLRELVNFISDEIQVVDYGEEHFYLQTAGKLKEKFELGTHPPGYIFSSGGTTGDPKYVHFSYEEFEHTTEMLAHNFRKQGIKPGMMVANLFVAGNLWSSFIAVEKALEKIGAIQLPIGGLCPSENILMYLKKFSPEVVMGIPSLLVMTAEQAKNLGIELKIKKIFYAGEGMSQTRKDFLTQEWGSEYFGSAGYASVDAGVIGYQCLHCEAGVHHVFSDMVELKIVNGEGIVSSLCRQSMAIKNYATGDRIEWVEGTCPCADASPRFRLLGRVDNLIQIWSCRLQLSDIEKSLQCLNSKVLSFQVLLKEKIQEGQVQEILQLTYEAHQNEVIPEEVLKQTIYSNSRDLKDTLSYDLFSKRIHVINVEHGTIPRNARTGKISLILDRRH